MRIAINGFGRIGKLIFRQWLNGNYKDIEIVAINDLGDISTAAHLLKYDSVHRTMNNDVSFSGDDLIINGKKFKYISERDPKKLPWKDLGIDAVFECTGMYKNKEKCQLHIDAGCKKVIISAPGDDVDMTVVYGVNDDLIDASCNIISNASCTTNCLAPVVKVLDRSIGVQSGSMSTVHSYTGDQRVVDTSHSDLRRARAAACNIIPTSTGAAKAIGLIFPELIGKLHGLAIRVPVPNVSLIDFTFIAHKNTTKDEINELMNSASKSDLKGVLQYCDSPLVSSDFIGSTYSSIFDSTLTNVINGNLCTIVSWYDNEYGFSCRMLDVAAKLNMHI